MYFMCNFSGEDTVSWALIIFIEVFVVGASRSCRFDTLVRDSLGSVLKSTWSIVGSKEITTEPVLKYLTFFFSSHILASLFLSPLDMHQTMESFYGSTRREIVLPMYQIYKV